MKYLDKTTGKGLYFNNNGRWRKFCSNRLLLSRLSLKRSIWIVIENHVCNNALRESVKMNNYKTSILKTAGVLMLAGGGVGVTNTA